MNDILIMTIIAIGIVEVGIVAFGAMLLWLGNKLIDMEVKRANEGVCE